MHNEPVPSFVFTFSYIKYFSYITLLFVKNFQKQFQYNKITPSFKSYFILLLTLLRFSYLMYYSFVCYINALRKIFGKRSNRYLMNWWFEVALHWRLCWVSDLQSCTRKYIKIALHFWVHCIPYGRKVIQEFSMR